VPGQVVSILAFMRALDVSEFGYRPDLGLRVFTQEALEEFAAAIPAPVRKPKKATA
jgi:arginine decarboxylase